MKQIFFVLPQSSCTTVYKVTEEKSICVSVSNEGARINVELGIDINQVAKARLANGYNISDEATYNEQLAKAVEMYS